MGRRVARFKTLRTHRKEPAPRVMFAIIQPLKPGRPEPIEAKKIQSIEMDIYELEDFEPGTTEENENGGATVYPGVATYRYRYTEGGNYG